MTTQATTTNDTAADTRKLETAACGRCGGSGNYGPTCVYGGKCFRCCGAGKVYTKRGAAALKFLESLRSKPAAELKAGDVVRGMVVTMGGAVGHQWETVTVVRAGVRETDGGRYVTDANGVEMVVPPELVVETDKCSHHTSAACVFRVKQDRENAARTYREAMDYQDTLTKAGTPRKR